MNVYVGIAWGLTAIFGICSVAAFAIAIVAYLGMIRVDAIMAVVLMICCACYMLAPLGYARARSR